MSFWTFVGLVLKGSLIIIPFGVIFMMIQFYRKSVQPDPESRCWHCLGEGNVDDYVCVVCDGSGEA